MGGSGIERDMEEDYRLLKNAKKKAPKRRISKGNLNKITCPPASTLKGCKD